MVISGKKIEDIKIYPERIRIIVDNKEQIIYKNDLLKCLQMCEFKYEISGKYKYLKPIKIKCPYQNEEI